ncbi:hypothetical protein [Nocardia farcinica]
MVHPIPIELTQSSFNWAAWAPVFASALVASATILSVWRTTRVTIRTNLEAISASDRREFEKWKRDEILRACAEVGEYCLHAEGDYFRFAFAIDVDKTPPDAVAYTLDGHGRKIGASNFKLSILGASKTAAAGAALRNAINDRDLVESLSSVMHLRSASAKASDQGQPWQRADELARATQLFRDNFSRIEPARKKFTETSMKELAALEAQPMPNRISPGGAG